MMLTTSPSIFQRALAKPVRRIFAQPRNHSRYVRSGKYLLDFPETARVERDRLNKRRPSWIGAMVSPCIFIGAVGHALDGTIAELRGAHFPTYERASNIAGFLSQTEIPAERTTVWVAGSAAKSSPDSLTKTAVNIQEGVGRFGIDLRLTWLKPDLPRLIEERSGRTISDLGLCMSDPSSGYSLASRMVSVAATSRQAVFLSTLSFEHNSTTAFTRTQLFSEQGDVFSFCRIKILDQTGTT